MLFFICAAAQAEEYMLPKSFSIMKFDAPVIEQKVAVPVNNSTKPVLEQKSAVPISNNASFTKQPIVQNVSKNSELAGKANVSLTNLIKNYEYDYSSTFKLTLDTLVQFNVIPIDCDSAKGQIRARLASSGREIFILLLPSSQKLTHVRITPADGNYNLPLGFVNQIFDAIDKNLQGGV